MKITGVPISFKINSAFQILTFLFLKKTAKLILFSNITGSLKIINWGQSIKRENNQVQMKF